MSERIHHRNSPTGVQGMFTAFKHIWNRSRGSISLMVINVSVVLFLGLAVLDLIGVTGRQTAYSFLGLSQFGIFQRLWLHQFLTAPLLHGGIGHLIFNMLVLWMMGPEIEKTLGRNRYIIFSILCAVSSMIGYLVLNWGDGGVVMGYSGVIFGILVAQALFFPNKSILFFFFFPLKMKYAVLIMCAVAMYLTVFTQGSGIAHAAHLFGALAAFLYIRGHSWLEAIRSKKIRLATPDVRVNPNRSKKRQDIPREL